MISVDTDILVQLSQTAQKAAGQLASASDILNQITTHDDWGCKERETINSDIQANRNKMLSLKDDTSNFVTVLVQITHQFIETEGGISDMFESVEGLLAKVLAVGTPEEAGMPNMVDGGRDTGIAVVSFDDILDSIENAEK